MSRGLSLANKCLLLFGAAVVIIIGAALVLPWIRLSTIVEQSQFETSRQIARLWVRSNLANEEPDASNDPEWRGLRVHRYPWNEWLSADLSPFETKAREDFARLQPNDKTPREHAESVRERGAIAYSYARVIEGDNGPIGVVVVERRSSAASGLIATNRLYLVLAWLTSGGLAILVFHLLTSRIILQPVRELRDTAEDVQRGDLSVRSDITTGDEFEQLSETFNGMLASLSEQQQQLRAMNKSLDMRVSELAQRNMDLYEAARVKGEFLASVSHELRTPLNSIIGFAELLQEQVDQDTENEHFVEYKDALGKRRRYLGNIVTSGRTLLEMINELLTMAKIEAGKIDLHVQPVNIAELCEALAALIRPLVDRKQQTIELQLAGSGGMFVSKASEAELPVVSTDPQKLQQIVFNFLSNAVKFTPENGHITLRAEKLLGTDGQGRVRLSVLDTGPGIPADQHEAIFRKFVQLDGGHTRQHQGSGLGLAIAREFATMLQGEIQLESETGRGSMFSLIVPMAMSEKPVQRRPMLVRS